MTNTPEVVTSRSQGTVRLIHGTHGTHGDQVQVHLHNHGTCLIMVGYTGDLQMRIDVDAWMGRAPLASREPLCH